MCKLVIMDKIRIVIILTNHVLSCRVELYDVYYDQAYNRLNSLLQEVSDKIWLYPVP